MTTEQLISLELDPSKKYALFTFGQRHLHWFLNQNVDKNTVLVYENEDGHARHRHAVLFGEQWSHEYTPETFTGLAWHGQERYVVMPTLDKKWSAFHKHCMDCKGKTHFIFPDTESMQEFRFGRNLIQNRAPGMHPGLREMVISGLCNDCFDSLFAED